MSFKTELLPRHKFCRNEVMQYVITRGILKYKFIPHEKFVMQASSCKISCIYISYNYILMAYSIQITITSTMHQV